MRVTAGGLHGGYQAGSKFSRQRHTRLHLQGRYRVTQGRLPGPSDVDDTRGSSSQKFLRPINHHIKVAAVTACDCLHLGHLQLSPLLPSMRGHSADVQFQFNLRSL